MSRYIGWALLTAFFFGIHLSADQAIAITARPSGDPGEGIHAAESDRRTERHEPHARVGSRRPGVPTAAAQSRSRVHRLREATFSW